MRCATPVILPRYIKEKTVHSGKHFGYGENSYFGDGTMNLYITMKINIMLSQKTYLSYHKIQLNKSLEYTHRTLCHSVEILFIRVQWCSVHTSQKLNTAKMSISWWIDNVNITCILSYVNIKLYFLNKQATIHITTDVCYRVRD